MSKLLDTVLLLALPASGKSEVRRYLEHPAREIRERDFLMGPTVQLDDYPYVHMMRRIDDELARWGKDRFFFKGADRPFQDTRHWGTLIELLNEDHADLVARRPIEAVSAGRHLLERFDASAKKVGAAAILSSGIEEEALSVVAAAIEAEARKLIVEKMANYPETLEGKTLVIEFARGGPDGASLPLPEPLGYRYSLSRLSPAILEKAVVLYVWVTPEESRRKNRARTDPNDPGSILHHGVPDEVMFGDYGCDDIEWLMAQASKPGTIPIAAGGKRFDIPLARFDNRVDKTSFIRNDPPAWKPEEITAVHAGLKAALQALG
jgi:hypothetical protein